MFPAWLFQDDSEVLIFYTIEKMFGKERVEKRKNRKISQNYKLFKNVFKKQQQLQQRKNYNKKINFLK